jgi:hypothetical protein
MRSFEAPVTLESLELHRDYAKMTFVVRFEGRPIGEGRLAATHPSRVSRNKQGVLRGSPSVDSGIGLVIRFPSPGLNAFEVRR